MASLRSPNWNSESRKIAIPGIQAQYFIVRHSANDAFVRYSEFLALLKDEDSGFADFFTGMVLSSGYQNFYIYLAPTKADLTGPIQVFVMDTSTYSDNSALSPRSWLESDRPIARLGDLIAPAYRPGTDQRELADWGSYFRHPGSNYVGLLAIVSSYISFTLQRYTDFVWPSFETSPEDHWIVFQARKEPTVALEALFPIVDGDVKFLFEIVGPAGGIPEEETPPAGEQSSQLVPARLRDKRRLEVEILDRTQTEFFEEIRAKNLGSINQVLEFLGNVTFPSFDLYLSPYNPAQPTPVMLIAVEAQHPDLEAGPPGVEDKSKTVLSLDSHFYLTRRDPQANYAQLSTFLKTASLTSRQALIWMVVSQFQRIEAGVARISASGWLWFDAVDLDSLEPEIREGLANLQPAGIQKEIKEVREILPEPVPRPSGSTPFISRPPSTGTGWRVISRNLTIEDPNGPREAEQFLFKDQKGNNVTWLQWLAASRAGSDNLDRFIEIFERIPFKKYYWECNPITRGSEIPFQFIIIEAPELPDTQNVKTYAEYFIPHKAARPVAVEFESRGRGVHLVAPFPRDPKVKYAHLGAFMETADQATLKSFWQFTFAQVDFDLALKPTLWVSTHGTEVAWLHIRISDQPFDYVYTNYAKMGLPGPAASSPLPSPSGAGTPSRSSISRYRPVTPVGAGTSTGGLNLAAGIPNVDISGTTATPTTLPRMGQPEAPGTIPVTGSLAFPAFNTRVTSQPSGRSRIPIQTGASSLYPEASSSGLPVPVRTTRGKVDIGKIGGTKGGKDFYKNAVLEKIALALNPNANIKKMKRPALISLILNNQYREALYKLDLPSE